MKSSKLCSMFLGLILISQSPLLSNAKSHNGLVSNICKASSNKESCTKLLGSNSKIARAKNFAQLSKIVLDMAYNKAIEGQNILKNLAESNNCAALKKCAHFDYDSVVMSFRSAIGELKDDPQSANFDAKVAGDGPAQCDRGFANANIDNPQVTAINREIAFFSELAFLATNNL